MTNNNPVQVRNVPPENNQSITPALQRKLSEDLQSASAAKSKADSIIDNLTRLPVHYSSEQFVNDGSMTNALLKHLKRTMAGEYSRELGVKVYAGQKRLVQLGHKMGGVAGFGLRRCLMLSDGSRRLIETGQLKTLSTDWVALVPGPAPEVKVVRQMFQMVAERGVPPATIARLMNSRGLLNVHNTPWTHHSVTEVLTNLKYVGANVWGRTSQRLHSKVSLVPPDAWITREGAFEPLIDRALFDRVQRRLARRTEHQSNDDLLEDLRKLWRKKGKLSQRLVALSDLTPSPCTYARRFGSLLKAYELIGYKMSRDCNGMIRHRDIRNQIRDEILTSFQTALPNRIRIVRLFNRRKPMLLIDGSIPCAVTVCPALITSDGRRRWLVRVRKAEKGFPSLLCVLDRDNAQVSRMYLCPPAGRARWYTKQEHDPWFRKYAHIQNADQLCSTLSSIAKGHSIPFSVLVPKTVGVLKRCSNS